jgi:hypothetical protein
LITDGLPAYQDAFNKEFFRQESPRSQHISAIKLNAKSNTAIHCSGINQTRTIYLHTTFPAWLAVLQASATSARI